MEVRFSRYDTADYLKTEDDIAAYLDAVMEDSDPALIAAALGDVARARNLSQLARDVGMSRQGLDKGLSRLLPLFSWRVLCGLPGGTDL